MLIQQPNNKQASGKYYESQAKAYLINQGLTLIEENFHSRFGEVDLIFHDSNYDCLVFVEVRFRRSAKFGGAAASVTKSKQQKVKKAALFYLSQRKLATHFRFDVIAFEQQQLNWIANAFT